MTTTADAAAIPSSLRHCDITTPIGELTAVRSDDGLRGLYFPDHSTRPNRRAFGLRSTPQDFDDLAGQLDDYLLGRRTGFDLPLAAAPTPVATHLRQCLLALPYGTTTTYGALARTLGTSPRAVGRLNAHNPLSIVVPCHRVIGATGTLVGYAGGLALKRRLLTLEGVPVAPA